MIYDNPSEEGAESSTSETPTATIPISILGGREVSSGDDIMLRVVNVSDDGIEVTYAHESEAEEPPEDGLDYMARTGDKRPPAMMMES